MTDSIILYFCNTCKQRLPFSAFPSKGFWEDVRRRACRDCRRRQPERVARRDQQIKAWRERRKAERTLAHAHATKPCLGCGQAILKARGIARCPGCAAKESSRQKVLKKNKITATRYKKMLAMQKGKCAICEGQPRARRLAVDHCHVTGRIRGLLCMRCNVALGLMGDDLKGLRRFEKYLIRFRKRGDRGRATAPPKG
jgi:hypothetical protein